MVRARNGMLMCNSVPTKHTRIAVVRESDGAMCGGRMTGTVIGRRWAQTHTPR